jgi:hypothetical protein
MDSKIINQLSREFDSAMAFKQGRVAAWQSSEDLYFGKVKKTLKNRSCVPIPVMSGFINTLFSKIDEPPNLKFEPTEESDTRIASKVQSLYQKDKKSQDYGWDMADLGAKKMAAFYGRGIFKAYGERNPDYRFNLDAVDPYNFYIDPLGGGWMENARYLGESGIWRDKETIQRGVDRGIYDKDEVAKLFSTENADGNVNDGGDQNQKANRFSVLNLSNEHNYTGDNLFNLVESGTTFEGERYYCLWSYEKKAILRWEKLTDVFKSNLWWWASFAPYHDENIFWTLSPADDIRPVAQAMFVLLNQELDNRQRTNWNMMAFDPDLFEGENLDWRPDGRIMGKKGSIKPLQNGIYQFQTPQLNGTINLVQYLDEMMGQKSGVTASAQGQSQNDKVGIYYGDMQQVADRLGLISKYYQNCWKAIGRRYVWNLHENLPRNTAIKMIGVKGASWEVVNRADINPDMDIDVESANAQMSLDIVKKKSRQEALIGIQNNPALTQAVNNKWLLEQILLTGDYTEEDVRRAMDKDWGNNELLAEAAEAIEKIVRNKEVKPNRQANAAYLQKILDYAVDETDDDFATFNKLMAYIDACVPFVIENMSRQLPIPTEQPLTGQPGAPQATPTPNTEAGTASQSQNLTRMATATAAAPGMSV